MRTSLCLYTVLGAILLMVSGCTTGRSAIDTRSSLEEIRVLQATLDQTGSAPSVEQYQFARQRFVGSMTDILAEQARQARSPARRIKNAITATGVILGLGGTVASFVIKDEDLRSAVAQASGGVAGITGIISLMPFGSGSKGAKALSAYLSAEMPLFEARWPAEMDRSLTVEEWAGFVQEVDHITSLAGDLGQ